MPSFTNTFGGTNIYPSDVSYRAISLSANTTLEWPTEVATGTNVAASIMDVTASSAGLTIRMPPADETSVGQTALFFNPGANAFTVADNSGNVITVVAAGESWQVYITDNMTAAGSWRTVEYGAGTSAPAAGALAGKGIKAITTTLNQSMPVFSYPIIPGTYSYTLDEALRAGTVLWDSGSTGTLTLATASTNGSDWFCHIRNNGAGSVILNCTGGDQINGLSSLTFGPGDSATLICDGSDYFTIGQGNASTSGILAFDYVALDLTGASSPYILQGVELNRVSYNFIGALTSNMEIVVPLNLQQYWVKNSTSGPHTLVVKTASGGGVQVQQGYAQILYCNGVNVVAANDPPGVTDIPVSAGGIYVDNFSGNGVTQIFSLSFAVTNEDRTQVYINGVYQQKNTYAVSGATLTFSSPPPSGTNNIEVVSLGAANYPASSVLFTPYGNLTSTNVQDAIEEEIDDLAASSGSSLIGFLQAGSGAVARTAQSKMRDVVSVKDFGAVGDGVTNASSAFTAALTASKSISIPSGDYLLVSSVTTDAPVVINGMNADSSLLTSGLVIDSAQTRYGYVLNVNLDGPNDGTGTGLTVDETHRMKFDGVTAKEYLNGADFNYAYLNTLINCEFSFNDTGAIFRNYTNGTTVYSSTFANNANNGAEVRSSQKFTFHGCDFENNTNYGLVLDSSDNATLQNLGCKVDSCYFENNGSDVIVGNGANAVRTQNAVFTDNVHLGNKAYGYLVDYALGTKIIRPDFTGATFSSKAISLTANSDDTTIIPFVSSQVQAAAGATVSTETIQTGSVDVTLDLSGFGDATITFPIEYYVAPPVNLTLYSNANPSGSLGTVSIKNGIGSTGVYVQVHGGPAGGTVKVKWQAGA